MTTEKRRVTVTLELDTCADLDLLESKAAWVHALHHRFWVGGLSFTPEELHQVQVNVQQGVTAKKKVTRKKARRRSC